jgi:hypothetical protein
LREERQCGHAGLTRKEFFFFTVSFAFFFLFRAPGKPSVVGPLDPLDDPVPEAVGAHPLPAARKNPRLDVDLPTNNYDKNEKEKKGKRESTRDWLLMMMLLLLLISCSLL